MTGGVCEGERMCAYMCEERGNVCGEGGGRNIYSRNENLLTKFGRGKIGAGNLQR